MPRCNNHRSLKLSTINITYWAWSTVLWWICFFFFTHRQNKPIHQIDYCTVYIRFSTFQRTSFCVDISYVGKLGGALFYRLIGSRVNELVIHLLLDRPNSLESSYLYWTMPNKKSSCNILVDKTFGTSISESLYLILIAA